MSWEKAGAVSRRGLVGWCAGMAFVGWWWGVVVWG
jgi:hypothetical protein